jgi:hypothetical protein
MPADKERTNSYKTRKQYFLNRRKPAYNCGMALVMESDFLCSYFIEVINRPPEMLVIIYKYTAFSQRNLVFRI